MENKQIIYYEQLDSTNVQAVRLAAEGAPHGTVVVAGTQTAGKGRRGRTWESPQEDNIYMSLLLRPSLKPNQAPMLTLVMAQSVAVALQKAGFPDVQIKWPNDLILAGKKICGILTEMYLQGDTIDYVVVGVGVNVNTRVFPKELQEQATSLRLQGGKVLNCDPLVKDILGVFEEYYQQFIEQGDLAFLYEQYNELLVNRGKEVCVLEPDNEYMAYAEGINTHGELIVRTAEGEEKAIFAGEVSVRGIYGYV